MPYNDRLFQLLAKMPEDELDMLWHTALKNKLSENEFSKRSKDSKVELISKDLRESAGHSLANLFRGEHDLAWKRVLIDVADKLSPGVMWTPFTINDDHSDSDVENRILEFVDERTKKAWEKLSHEEQTRLVTDINQRIEQERKTLSDAHMQAALKSITVDGMSTAMTAGLLTGGGMTLLITGSTAALVGGVLGGIFTQIGLWLVVQFAGWWLGLKLIIGGGLGAIGFAAVAAPAAIFGASTTLMNPSYSKTIPAVILILSSNRIHMMFEEAQHD